MNSKVDAFQMTRETLKAKPKHLKKIGKWNCPNRASMLTDNQVNVLYEKELLGEKFAVNSIFHGCEV